MKGSKRLRDKASKYAKTAIEYEEHNELKKAAVNYFRAVKALSKVLELSSPENLEKIYKNRIQSYKKRIRKIYSSLESEKERKKRMDKEENSKIFDEAILIENTNVTWENIGGLNKAKKSLKEASIWPIKRPDIFKGPRKPWKGVLLFGPPGCGKTMLAKAVANEADATFFNIDSATILSKWFGKSEKLTKQLFKEARKREPSIIYIDEVESIAGKRSRTGHEAMKRVKTVFLSQMDGIQPSDERVIVIGSTNLPAEIDMAFRRRFEKRIYVPSPKMKDRKEILKIHLQGIELAKNVNLEKIAVKTKGYTGHDLNLLVREVAMLPIRELASEDLLAKKNTKVRNVKMEDFERVLQRKNPSLDQKERERYEKWAKRFAS